MTPLTTITVVVSTIAQPRTRAARRPIHWPRRRESHRYAVRSDRDTARIPTNTATTGNSSTRPVNSDGTHELAELPLPPLPDSGSEGQGNHRGDQEDRPRATASRPRVTVGEGAPDRRPHNAEPIPDAAVDPAHNRLQQPAAGEQRGSEGQAHEDERDPRPREGVAKPSPSPGLGRFTGHPRLGLALLSGRRAERGQVLRIGGRTVGRWRFVVRLGRHRGVLSSTDVPAAPTDQGATRTTCRHFGE